MYEFIGLPAQIDKLIESANKLGSPTLNVELELDEDALQEATNEILEFQMTVLELVAKAQKQIYNVSLQIMAAYEISSVAAGYAGGKIMDTNEDPSDFKTWATLFVSGGVGYVIGGVVSSLILNQKIKGLDLNKGLESYKDPSKLIIDTLKTINEISDLREQDSESGFLIRQRHLPVLNEIRDLLVKILKTYTALRTFAGLASFYHGFKRNNDNIGYGLAWGITGLASATPIGLALEQGFAKPLN